MAKTLEQVMAMLTPAERTSVAKRTAELLADEMTLRQLRKARGRTQKKVAAALKISQDGVSRIEKRSDFLLSTLRSYVEAMGGQLRLIAEFPGREPITISNLDGLGMNTKPRRRVRKSTGAEVSADPLVGHAC